MNIKYHPHSELEYQFQNPWPYISGISLPTCRKGKTKKKGILPFELWNYQEIMLEILSHSFATKTLRVF